MRQRLRERAQNHVGDALRGFNIAARYRGGMLRVDHGACGRDDRDGPRDAGVVEDVFRDQAAKSVERRRKRDGEVGIDAAGSLVVRAGEINDSGVACNGDGAANVDRLIGKAVVVERVGEAVGAVGDLGDSLAQDALSVVLRQPGVMCDLLVAVALDQLQETRFRNTIGSYLRSQIAFAFVRRADIGEDEGQDFGYDFATFFQAHGRDDEPFLKDLACQWHGAGTHAAHVRVMGAIGHEEYRSG